MPGATELDATTRARKIVARLIQEYPDARCALDYTNPLELLIATILSAQCTDERVNIVTKDLFIKYTRAIDYAVATQEQLEQDIKSIGLFRRKAQSLRATCQALVERFDGEVPDTLEELVTLPGVARKTANVVLGNAFGVTSGVVVDTHVFRLAHRMGLTTQLYADKVEEDLMALLPKKRWVMAAHVLIFHGRQVCTALRPHCAECVVARWCPRLLDAPKPK
ncbi:MAG TPA: endonuclease III [Armatimonadota bacterium]|nr:endonuclease III [Armatimonadota bacterium]HQK95718.1 endonuclease III [Armatimonadota bacterium]